MFRQFAILLTIAAMLGSCGFKRKKYENPITKDTQQPDKILFDKSIHDIEKGRYEVARLTLNTLINTYDTSEFLAKAKLAIADSWYREGGTHGMAQAEAEYKDFILFYPAMEEAAESARGKGPIAAFYIETPANPTNGMVDLEHARKIVSGLLGPDGKRPVIIVDNTLLGPIYQTPLAHGADLVVTSLTKYVGGHSDLIAGACSGTAAILEPIRGMRTILGTMCDPHTGWLLMRSLETLKLRMTAAAEGACKVAGFLNTHPKVASVWYLGFLPEGHPDRPVFERQCKSPGSTFSFEVRGG